MDLSVKQKFESYPENIADLLSNIRDLIYRVAKQDEIIDLTETLKWGEPRRVDLCGMKNKQHEDKV
ncbi:hypothetical protein EIJ81_00030 (plasmid) [Aliivibrio salmonicida]|uniref:hypothetical protein n=1 Tax=Aliivibrio salmonicida TaxID=40269 RepID=UPI000F6E94CD|nr:hypothetical protein [Aliivibrio salmonicida]AZL83299.1 hypothetical protein EIJ81_00030 [Aliivibrio salmonicida]